MQDEEIDFALGGASGFEETEAVVDIKIVGKLVAQAIEEDSFGVVDSSGGFFALG